MQHLQHPYAWWPTLAVLIVATVTDLRSRRIPNWLVFPFLLGGLVVSNVGRRMARARAERHWNAARWGLIYGVLAMMGGMGMGDVKLCAAIGAWIWWQQLVFALVMIAVAGGFMQLRGQSSEAFQVRCSREQGICFSDGKIAGYTRLRTSSFLTRRHARCLMRPQ